jgi:hypothetical protein
MPEESRMLTGSTSGEFTVSNGLMFNFEIFLHVRVPLLTDNRETYSDFPTVPSSSTGIGTGHQHRTSRTCYQCQHHNHPLPLHATLFQARDANVWALTFCCHPLGHALVSASRDHKTRFWARK